MATSNQTVNQPVVKRPVAKKHCPACNFETANRSNKCPNCGYDYINKTMPFQAKQPKAAFAAKIKETKRMPEVTPADYLKLDISDLSKLRERMTKFPLEFYEKANAAIDIEGQYEKLKMDLARIEVEADTRIRKEFTDKGVKFTEKIVENAITLDETVENAKNALFYARQELRRAKAIVEATESLGKILIGLADDK